MMSAVIFFVALAAWRDCTRKDRGSVFEIPLRARSLTFKNCEFSEELQSEPQQGGSHIKWRARPAAQYV
jgi:hypothetical protein